MTMIFSPQNETDYFSGTTYSEIESVSIPNNSRTDENIRLFADKLRIPSEKNFFKRPHLDDFLQKSFDKIGAMIVTGRAGTGKSVLAANFSKKYAKTFWYRIEAADLDWKIFSGCLSKCLTGKSRNVSEHSIAARTELLFDAPEKRKSAEPRLIVLDDAHKIFDAEWFDEFFKTALYSLPLDTHLLMLSRSKPTCPLWRLRSKQVLAVLDEKTLILDAKEIAAYCGKPNLSVKEIIKYSLESSGRIGKLKTILRNE